MDSISVFQITSDKENTQCIKTVFTVPNIQSFVIILFSVFPDLISVLMYS